MSETKPHLWLAHDDRLDEPIWFLPLESQEGSQIWHDDDLEIEIVWWD